MSLKLRIEDKDDLAVVSAHLQDAILRVGDIAHLPRSRRIALSANRFCWEDVAGVRSAKGKITRRVNCGVHFDHVLKVAARHIDQTDTEALLYLLAAEFKSEDGVSGQILLTFAGGGSLRIDVECLEGGMSDRGEPWLTENCPAHDLGAEVEGAGRP